ncbi:MAG: hypothetical protein ACK5NC_15730 [Vibrio sp.]
MKNFGAGFNNFFVGLFSGLLLPIVIIVVLLFLTVDKLTNFAQDAAIAPLYQRGAQTLDKVDVLLTSLDTKVNEADLKDLQLLAPLKDANLFPELKQIAGTIQAIRTSTPEQKQAVIENLEATLITSLQDKFPKEKAQELATHLAGIAELLAAKKDQIAENKDQLLEKRDALADEAQELKSQVQDLKEQAQDIKEHAQETKAEVQDQLEDVKQQADEVKAETQELKDQAVDQVNDQIDEMQGQK